MQEAAVALPDDCPLTHTGSAFPPTVPLGQSIQVTPLVQSSPNVSDSSDSPSAQPGLMQPAGTKPAHILRKPATFIGWQKQNGVKLHLGKRLDFYHCIAKNLHFTGTNHAAFGTRQFFPFFFFFLFLLLTFSTEPQLSQPCGKTTRLRGIAFSKVLCRS